MKKEKKKQSTLQLILKVLPAVVNTANLVIALVLALQRRKAISAAIDDNGLRENHKDVLVFGGDKGPTALYVGKNGPSREESAVAVANAVAAELAKDGPTSVYVKNGRAIRQRSQLAKH